MTQREAFACWGEDGDKRQGAAIDAYAKAAGVEIVETYYDEAISGEWRILGRVPRAAQAVVWPSGSSR